MLLYKLMAQAYFGKGEYGMAIELYEKARSQCPNDDTDILL